MRVLIVAEGTRGDVQPMTVLGRQLQHEGHLITFAGPPSFREFVESKGLVFSPLPFDSEAMIRANAASLTSGLIESLRLAPKLFLRSVEAQLYALPALAKQSDFILVGGVHGGVPTVAEYAGVPWRWVLYTSVLFPSSAHPPMIAPFGRAPRLLNKLMWKVTRWLTNRTFRGTINAHRVRLNLPPLADITPHIMCRNPILAMEPELAPIPPEWSKADVIGYLDPGEGDLLPPEIEAFLDQGPAPVYIGFGSMPDRSPRETTRCFVDATYRAGVRAVISRGWAHFGQDLPDHCIAVGPVSHPRLFERMAAVVHHGGAGTTAAAARAGKPQLIVPHVADQFFFGDIVQRLGIGVSPIRRTALRVDALAERLRRLTSDRAMRDRAERLGATIRARPRPENLSRLLVERAGASMPVLPIGRRVSIAPPGL